MKLLVTGAGGMVGAHVRDVFGGDELVLTDIVAGFPRLDVREPAAVLATVTAARPDTVLHLAAATDVDRCQQEPDWAYHSNALGTQNVALACQASGAAMVYVSTGAVFAGDQPEPYVEFDDPAPANLYARARPSPVFSVTRLPAIDSTRPSRRSGGGSRGASGAGGVGPAAAGGLAGGVGVGTAAGGRLAGARTGGGAVAIGGIAGGAGAVGPTLTTMTSCGLVPSVPLMTTRSPRFSASGIVAAEKWRSNAGRRRRG